MSADHFFYFFFCNSSLLPGRPRTSTNFSSCFHISPPSIFHHHHHHRPSSSFKIISSPRASAGDDKYDIVSTTRYPDGSILFQFGDAREIARKAELKKSDSFNKDSEAKVIEKDDVINTMKPIDCNREQSQVGINSNYHFVGEVAVHRQDSSGHGTEKSENLSVETILDEKSSAASSDFGSGLEANVDGEEFPVEMISYKALTPVGQSEVIDHVTKEETVDGNDEVSSSAINSRTDAVSLEELSQEDNDTEVACQSDSSVSNSHFEGHSSFIAEDGVERNASDVNHQSAPSSDHDVHTNASIVIADDVHKTDAVQLVPELISVNADAILNQKSTCNAVELHVDIGKLESMHTTEADVQSRNFKEEIAEGDGQSSSGADVSFPVGLESKPTEATANRKELSTTRFFLSSGAASFPHPSKALTGGEDAYFLDENCFGIADGVGQWSLEGVSTGIYAQELMRNCRKIFSSSTIIPITDPAEVLHRAAVETQSPGSSTALVAYFDGQVLHAANFGDSGFIIIRNDAIFKRSSPMVHEFNFPLQIVSGHEPSKRLEEYKINVDEGDIIIIATDGLFDNLYEKEIASVISKSLKAGLQPQEIADLLARKAQEVGKSTSARTPFADEAQAAGYVGYTGGRLDDVTVVFSLVENRSASDLG